MANYVTNTSDKSKKTAMICCIFAGMFGIHHFYVGNIFKGFVYLFTGGLLTIGWIIDLIKIAAGTFTDGAGTSLRR